MDDAQLKKNILRLFNFVKSEMSSKSDEERKKFISDIRGENGNEEKKKLFEQFKCKSNLDKSKAGLSKSKINLIWKFLEEHILYISINLHSFPYKINLLHFPKLNLHLGWDGYHDYYENDEYKCVIKVSKHYLLNFNLIFYFKTGEKVEITASFKSDNNIYPTGTDIAKYEFRFKR